MRRLSDNQSRQVCRWAFLLLCALPTIVVIVLATRVWSTDDWELLIAAELNLDVEIERVENPFPGRTVLHAVEIRRGAECIGSARQIECNWMGDWKLNLSGVRVEADGLERLRLSLEELTARQGPGSQRPWHLHCPELSLTLPGKSATASAAEGLATELRLADVELLSSPAAEQTRQLLRFRLPQMVEGADYPLELRILREPLLAQRQVWLKVSNPTPGWLLAALGCFPPGWDEELLFRGSLEFRQADNGLTSGQLDAAVLSNIDLECLRADWGLPFNGRAEVQIPSLIWREGRVKRAEFQVHAADGELSPGWLEALGRIPGLQRFDLGGDRAEQEQVPFRLFAARFLLQSGSCRVTPVAQSTLAICWDHADQPLLAIEPNSGFVQTDLEVLARLSLEPEHPELLADDQLVELLRHFHLPPDSRSARQPNAPEWR